MRNCSFLSQHGTPKSIVAACDFSDPSQRSIAYRCSLCGLCGAVCPERLAPSELFLEVRRLHVAAGSFDSGAYRGILGYETLGRSKLFSWYGLPEGCDTVFFPGCTLPGTRPSVTWQTYQRLRREFPALGMVLACCAKPSHDLGRTGHFRQVFGEVLSRLAAGGVKTVLTACPNCTKIFRGYGEGMAVKTVYEVLHRPGLKGVPAADGREVSVHDPCPLRYDPEVHEAVRGLLSEMGYAEVAMPHRKETAICCGEGGSVGCVEPALSGRWVERRRLEAGGRRLVTYCAGCAGNLGQATPTVHVLDLLFRQVGAGDDDIDVSRGLKTYLNRLLLKLRLRLEAFRG